MNMLNKTLLTVAAVASVAGASAAPLTGAVTFTGVATLNNANSALATSVSITSPLVVSSTGAGLGTIVTGVAPTLFASPLSNGLAAGTDIWSASGFTFTTSAILGGVGGPNNTYSISVPGMIDDGPGGWDATPAMFTLTTTPTINGLGVFASISSVRDNPDVPDAPSSIALLGLGLVALGIRRQAWI